MTKIRTFTEYELKEVLDQHKLWLADNRKGQKADLTNAYLTKANLYNADLSYAYLTNANLTNADLSYANLSNANLTHASLYNANLINTNLSDANLSNANLYNANLSDANLTNAYLAHANLTNADLSYADLSHADLSNATKYSLNQLPYLKVCNYYENNKWVRFENTDKYKQDLIKLTIIKALKSKELTKKKF